jgi:hypothetical protein
MATAASRYRVSRLVLVGVVASSLWCQTKVTRSDSESVGDHEQRKADTLAERQLLFRINNHDGGRGFYF